jgi:hypothetical protein
MGHTSKKDTMRGGRVLHQNLVYTKLVNFLRRKHKRRGKGFRAFPPSFFKKAGLYQLHGTIVHTFRTPRGERGRKAG